MKKSKIGVLFGGRSEEHEVSLKSAFSVIKALDPDKFEPIYIGITRKGDWKRYDGPPENIKDGSWEKYSREFDPGALEKAVDFVFPVLHGPYGEDGRIQGFLETLDIPYAGCGVPASAVSMDKQLFKQIMKEAGLDVCRFASFTKREILSDTSQAVRRAEACVGLPCFVKPANMGSSVGISKAETEKELEEALKKACRYDDKIIAEEYIRARELEIAVLGGFCGDIGHEAEFSDVGEIITYKEFYDYSAKYESGKEQSALVIPAETEPETKVKLTKMASAAYEAVGGFGFARIDFFMEINTGKIYINEINTIPGFTENSMFPLLWRNKGLEYRQIIERIIDSGYERYYAENNR